MTTKNISRVSYKIGPEAMEVSLGGQAVVLAPVEQLKNQLHFMGLRGFLQAVTANVAEEGKLELIANTYNGIMANGVLPTISRATGAPKRLEKVAALAAIKRTTVSKVQEILAGFPKEHQDKILNRGEVIAKVYELRTSAPDLGLDLDLED